MKFQDELHSLPALGLSTGKQTVYIPLKWCITTKEDYKVLTIIHAGSNNSSLNGTFPPTNTDTQIGYAIYYKRQNYKQINSKYFMMLHWFSMLQTNHISFSLTTLNNWFRKRRPKAVITEYCLILKNFFISIVETCIIVINITQTYKYLKNNAASNAMLPRLFNKEKAKQSCTKYHRVNLIWTKVKVSSLEQTRLK